MNKFLKLVNFEMNRFRKFFFVLLLITFVLQFAGVIVTSFSFTHRANKMMAEMSMTPAQFVKENGYASFEIVSKSLWFMGPIAICAVVLGLYIFLIWYRDWFGKNTFIYRLLMLPTSRINLFLSKAAAIFLYVLGLIAFQLIILPFENALFKGIVPSELKYDLGIRALLGSNEYMSLIIPHSFFNFVIYYGAGLVSIFIIFTGILFERSYRLKGIILGIVYCAVAAVVLFSPFIVAGIVLKNRIFYPIEVLGLSIITALIVLFGSLSVSGYLLKNKVTV